MGTRARIGIKNLDGSILSVYHHWDGYPSWLGKKLREKYNTRESIIELISGGDISTLESKHDWNLNPIEPRPLYYSERGENCPAQSAGNFQGYIDQTRSCGGEFCYLFRNGKWEAFEIISSNLARSVDIPS